MHWLRRWYRGTNSASILAELLSNKLSARLASGGIVRRQFTRPQSGLSPAEHLANVRGAFRLRRPKKFAGQAVLLADDILTTVATTNEIARLLMKAEPVRWVWWLSHGRMIVGSSAKAQARL
jgi:predicted amidophosphoribosyltransferase